MKVIKSYTLQYIHTIIHTYDIAFNCIGCSGLADGREPFLLRTLSARATNYEIQEIYKIGLSKMRFVTFPGPELVTRECLLSIKNVHKK